MKREHEYDVAVDVAGGVAKSARVDDGGSTPVKQQHNATEDISIIKGVLRDIVRRSTPAVKPEEDEESHQKQQQRQDVTITNTTTDEELPPTIAAAVPPAAAAPIPAAVDVDVDVALPSSVETPPSPPSHEAAPALAPASASDPSHEPTRPTSNPLAGLTAVEQWKAILNDPDPFNRNVLQDLAKAECVEPYFRVEKWRRAPWDPNPYESIGPGFVVAKDMPKPDSDVVLEKLSTSLKEGWMDLPPSVMDSKAAATAATDETPCMVCGRTDGEESFVLCDGCPRGGHYQCLNMPGVPSGDWYCPVCKPAVNNNDATAGAAVTAAGGGDNDAATPMMDSDSAPPPAPPPAPAPLPTPPPHVAIPNVMNRQPLKLGVDVEERPMWGMDCYTRVAIMSALGKGLFPFLFFSPFILFLGIHSTPEIPLHARCSFAA